MRLTRFALFIVLFSALAGCSGLRTIQAEVSTFGSWPAERKPGSFAFERLPSQEAQAAEQQALEEAARPALLQAGMKPAEAGQQPDVLVQVGLHVARTVSPWEDPLWWRGGFGYWRARPWGGPGWATYARLDPPRYEREVAVLVRERESGKPLFEAHASVDSMGSGDAALLQALFEAAMKDFPRQGINPRRVVVTLPH